MNPYASGWPTLPAADLDKEGCCDDIFAGRERSPNTSLGTCGPSPPPMHGVSPMPVVPAWIMMSAKS